MSRSDYPFSIKLTVIHDPKSVFFITHPCPKLWSNVYVGWEGDIAYCCYSQPESELGNIFKGYDFNSSKMVGFRRAMINHNFPERCQFCQRRFMDSFFGRFDARKNRWILPKEYDSLINYNHGIN